MRLFQAIGICMFGTFFPAATMAQDAGFQHVQSGALLTFADAETRILWAAVTAKEFDPQLAKAVLAELEHGIGQAKRSVERTASALSDSNQKLEAPVLKLRDLVKMAETQLGKLAAKIEEETQTGDESTEADDGAEDEPKQVDWAGIKAQIQWLAADLSASKKAHVKLVGLFKLRAFGAVPKASKKREP